MKPVSNSLAISFFITSFLSWAKRQSRCLTDLTFGSRCNSCSVLNQLPRSSRHAIRLPCEDVPILQEEFDERKFLFRIQPIAYVSNLERLLCGQQNRLAECVLRLDECLGGLSLRHDRV
jgi:hypothetical protein